MATLSSSRLYDLIDRFLFRPRKDPPMIFDIVRPQFSGVRKLADLSSKATDETDAAWLMRRELRSARAVVQHLETSEFPKQGGLICALLVDERCGLIGTLPVGNSAEAFSTETMAKVLRRAAELQASGMMLATNDPQGAIASSSRCRDFTLSLYEKGRAIDLHLLDHFVLARGEWKRMMAVKLCDQI